MASANNAIGIFDSGIGGLTVAGAIHQLLPNENLIYFGDTAHFPYGDKSAGLIEQYGTDRVQFKPEAKPVKDRAIAIQKIAAGQAKIYEGQSGLELMDTHSVGLAGTMPGSEIPWALVKLWDSLEANDVEKAREIHRVIAQLVGFQKTIDAYVAVEKYLLVKQGIFTSARQRGPVNTILSDEVKKEIDKVFADLQEVTRD
jgi:4-hydroxy-tetrahydrodipicolinate synthase